MKTKTHKFSAVELMTVIAVVMTLLSVLFTSMKTSKDSAIQVACMSNISQIRTYTELHRKDNGKLPYSEIWLTDFSYATPYMEGSKAELAVFTCPGSNDAALTSTDQLAYNTSYYYVPGRAVLENNIADGSAYGFSLLSLASLADKNQLVIYDKSPDHHNGKINTAYLFGDTGNAHELEGQIVTNGNGQYLALDGAGQINLETAATYGGLNLNPNNSDDSVFTLTDTDGNVITIRTNDGSTTGTAVSISLQVKNTGRTLDVGDVTLDLDTNTTYTIDAIGVDAYFVYDLIHESDSGNSSGKWWLDLYEGSGSITVTNDKTGEVTSFE